MLDTEAEGSTGVRVQSCVASKLVCYDFATVY